MNMVRKILLIACIVLIALIGVSFSSAQLAQLWKTGQTATYSTGDDGNLQTGTAWPTPRFADNADGTATDNLTGLMWLKDANCFSTQSWSNALSKVADFNIHPGTYSCSGYAASYGDWRLPNRKELLSLIDRSRWNPALSAGHPFVNVQSASYWSNSGILASWSTVGGWSSVGGWSTVGGTSSGSAWAVSLYIGTADKLNTAYSYAVWPVRSVITAGTATIAVSPQSADFGNVAVNAASAPQEFVIANAGSGDLAVSSIGTAGANATMFSVAAGGTSSCASLSPVLSANTSCTVLVTFIPTSGGAKTASLKIVSNDPATPVFQAPLSGSGVYTLSVTKTGAGSGTVTSVPAGISCGTDCSETYSPNTIVTLTAASDSGSVFAGWTVGGAWSSSGGSACPGTGPCTVTMNSAQTVAASFNLVISGGLTVLSPNGGEVVKKGTTSVISWSYTGNPGATVKIELLKGGVVNKTLTTAAPVGSNGAGSYNWSVANGQTLGSDYTIRISSSSGFTDNSNGSFTIAK